MPRLGIAFLLCVGMAFALSPPIRAQMSDQLEREHFGSIAPGQYQAGDSVHFMLDRYRNDPSHAEFLLRFQGQPEVYVLYADYGSLGGSVLRYDSGAIAIQIAGWGGMTIYTDDDPDGLPATRTGDSNPPSPPSVSLSQMQGAADDEASHLGYVRNVHVSFTADWGALGSDSGLRAIAFDAMENAARGIDRFTANPAARAAFVQRVTTIHMQTNDRPLIRLTGKTLIVTFNPRDGYQGRASSRAISFALGKLFSIPMPN